MSDNQKQIAAVVAAVAAIGILVFTLYRQHQANAPVLNTINAGLSPKAQWKQEQKGGSGAAAPQDRPDISQTAGGTVDMGAGAGRKAGK